MFERIGSIFVANIGTKIVSIIIALVLWVVVLGSRNVEVTKEIPVEVITSQDIISSNDVPEKIAFRLAGPKAFLRAVLDRREDPIRVNLVGAKTGLVTYRFFSDNIRLPIGVKVLSISPSSIPVKLEYVKRKEVPVKVELRGVPPEGYRVVNTEIRPETVRIKGAETRVENVKAVTTVPIDVTDLRQDYEREANLELQRHNVQLDGAIPIIHVKIEPTQANYKIKNVDVRVLSNRKFSVTDRNVTIYVRATADDLKLLDRSRVYATVDLRTKQKGSYREEVKVTLPNNIGLVRVIPDKINVTVH